MKLVAPDWLGAVRARLGSRRLAAARRQLEEQLALYRRALPALPDRQAGYYHDYFCPRHAVQLIFDPHQPRRHVCPIDAEVFTGEPYDAAWRWSVNDMLSDAALKIALRGGEGASRAVSILAGYAERYRTIPPAPRLHPRHPGVVTWSGLDESVWAIRLAWAHGLLGETLDAATDRAVREDLFRPAAEHLMRVRWPGRSNITCWNNAALATLAVALDDAALLAEVVDGADGVRFQLERGVLDDGFWWEGSLSYHYYTLAALIWTARALRAAGRRLAALDEAVRAMLRAPIALAHPDLTLPAINNCWYFIGLTGEAGHGIPTAAGFYEIGYGWYCDPAFAWVLRRNYDRDPRAAFEALLDGADEEIPDAPDPTGTRHRSAASGLAVLRTPEPRDRQSYLLLKAGPDAADHAHSDQLAIQLFAHGSRIVTDLGTPGYGVALWESWYTQTGSHATVLLDRRSQPIVAASLERVEERDGFALVSGSVTWETGHYAHARFRRTLLWRERYLVDVFVVDCPIEREIDWVLPVMGRLVAGPKGVALKRGLAGECGYGALAEVRKIRARGGVRLGFDADEARLDLYLGPAPTDALYVGVAPANPATASLAVAVRRRVATQRTAFLAVLAPASARAERHVRGVRWAVPGASADGTSGPTVVAVTTAKGLERWTIPDDPASATLVVG